MKRRWIGILLLGLGCAAALSLFVFVRPVHEHPEGAPVHAVPPSPPPGSPDFCDEMAAPIRVTFETPGPGESGPVLLRVETDPKGWPADAEGEHELEILLRLPAGVRLEPGEWTAAEPPPDEKAADPTGPWNLFELRRTVQVPVGGSVKALAEEPIRMAVSQEGTNWVITVRARISRGGQVWQAFGVLFATRQGDVSEFHTAPKSPADALRARTDETGIGNRSAQTSGS